MSNALTHCKRGLHEFTPENSYYCVGSDGFEHRRCRACLAAYRLRNRERRIAQSRERYTAKRDEIRAQGDAYYAANRERVLAAQRDRRDRDPERVRAMQREYLRAWRARKKAERDAIR